MVFKTGFVHRGFGSLWWPDRCSCGEHHWKWWLNTSSIFVYYLMFYLAGPESHLWWALGVRWRWRGEFRFRIFLLRPGLKFEEPTI
jgi:hypothetical protein